MMEPVATRVAEMLKNSHYTIVQSNGQRIFEPRYDVPFPPRGTEIFIGKLVRNMYEDELVPILSQPGPIYQLRLMVDFTGKNRGYCFVRYFTIKAATRAVQLLHNYPIRRGCCIGVYKSLDNIRLFIGGIPCELTASEVKEALECYMDNIVSVIMYPKLYDRSKNRGYAFLEFENHRAAAIARRKLPTHSLVLWGRKVKIDWAEPLPEPDPEVMAMVTTLYIKYVPPQMGYHALVKCINNVMDTNDLIRICKIKDYCFLEFGSRVSAIKAMHTLKKIALSSQPLEICWARPKSYSKRQNPPSTPNHYCLSLPAKQRWVVRRTIMLRNAQANLDNSMKTCSS